MFLIFSKNKKTVCASYFLWPLFFTFHISTPHLTILALVLGHSCIYLSTFVYATMDHDQFSRFIRSDSIICEKIDQPTLILQDHCYPLRTSSLSCIKLSQIVGKIINWNCNTLACFLSLLDLMCFNCSTLNQVIKECPLLMNCMS